MLFEPLVVRLLNWLAPRPRAEAPPKGVLLGAGTSQSGEARAVVWPEARLCEHVVVVGKTGMGKTHFLLHAACEHMRQGRGFLFLDFHGDATAQLTQLAARHPEARERLVLLDPTDPDRSPGLNPLEVVGGSDREAFARASELALVLRQRWGVDSFGARTEELLRNTLYTLASCRLTLADAPMLLTRQDVRVGLAAALPSPDVRDYWSERFEPLSEAMKAQFREPLLNKITAFLTDPLVRQFLGQQTSTVSFARAMEQGHWVIVNLAKGTLGEHAHTLGNLVFAKLQFEILARGRLQPEARRTFAVICDEVQNLRENDIGILLTEGRKFGVSLVTANQHWDQLPPSLRGALLATGTQVFFRVSSADAGPLAAELSIDGRKRYAEELTMLTRGEAIVRIGADPPVRIRVPGLAQATAATRREAAEVTSLSRHRYARDRNRIEQEIEQRQRRPVLQPNTQRHDEDRRDAREGQEGW